MKRMIALIAVVVMVCGVAYSAVTTGTFGDQNASKAYRMSVDSDGVITMAPDTTLTGGKIDGVAVGSATASTGKFTNLEVTGTIVDTAIYTKAAGSYPQRLATIGVDGNIYGTRSVLIDTGLYTASAGTGGSKSLRISVDGTIYAF